MPVDLKPGYRESERPYWRDRDNLCMGVEDGLSRKPSEAELLDELNNLPSIASFVNDRYKEITAGYQKDDRSVFADYTEEQQKTFYKQEHEARSWLDDNLNQTPFIDGMVLVGWRTKPELVDRIVLKADLLSSVYGSLIEKYQYLIGLLVDVDISGDFETEKAALDLIVW